jgi:VWFA-related protein
VIRPIAVAFFTLAVGLVHVAPKEPGSRNASDKLREEPVIVKVSVLYEDTGAFVPNLRAEDFVIEENGEKQKPTRFLQDERPLSILLLLDTSGSMRPILDKIVLGLSKSLNHLKTDDEIALIEFKDDVQLLQDFTTDVDLVVERLRGVVASRQTLARQALLQGATHMLKATPADSRRIMVVVTDNRPSTPEGALSENVVQQQLSACGSVVSGVFVSDPRMPSQGLFPTKATDDLTPFVNETGGILGTVKKINSEEIAAKVTKAIDAFRDYYWIEYYPTDTKKDGTHRKIKVSLSADARRARAKVTVLAKRGYFAPSPAKSDEKKDEIK